MRISDWSSDVCSSDLSMNKSGAAAGADGADGAANIPTITVMTPGMQSVQTVISANGSIAARREMPVGVVGEGGEVVRVLVEPGQWVGAGPPLSLIDRTVPAQQEASLAASIPVPPAHAHLTPSEPARPPTPGS